eukprot:m.14918 g.14918  ORF g.14918 m.14918 type:complete len:220 (-) comp4928_c0_seq2:172-831(-)
MHGFACFLVCLPPSPLNTQNSYTKTSCGAASFISATIAGIDFEGFEVDIGKHTLVKTNEDFFAINPKGNVPTIVLEDGTLLNENVATLAWIAANAKNDKVGAKEGPNYFLLINALGFLASELHQGIGGLFNPSLDEPSKKTAVAKANDKIAKFVAQFLDGGKKKFLVGDSFTPADAYAAVILSWCGYVGLTPPAEADAYASAIRDLPDYKAAAELLAQQ